MAEAMRQDATIPLAVLNAFHESGWGGGTSHFEVSHTLRSVHPGDSRSRALAQQELIVTIHTKKDFLQGTEYAREEEKFLTLLENLGVERRKDIAALRLTRHPEAFFIHSESGVKFTFKVNSRDKHVSFNFPGLRFEPSPVNGIYSTFSSLTRRRE